MTSISGKDAWKRISSLREWFEVVLNVATEPHDHVGYVCKHCWQQFNADTSPLSLEGHAILHEQRGEQAYSTNRLESLTGEKIIELHKLISTHFQPVVPEAGTWKFECLHCGKRLPHRSDYRELIQHGTICSERQTYPRTQ
jgi:DNA-directed RNA polymerase subunit RPC12/RpoP